VRVLVYPHTMEIGGCQLNAVETAGALRERGHDDSAILRRELRGERPSAGGAR
jgi:hypothetical protein